MENKRFTVHRTIGMLSAFYVNDNLSDKVVIDQIIHKYEADRLCKKLNALNDENEELKQQINDFKLHYTRNYREFNKDELYVKDTNTEIELKNGNMVITVFVPQINQYEKFNYYVTGRRGLMRVIE